MISVILPEFGTIYKSQLWSKLRYLIKSRVFLAVFFVQFFLIKINRNLFNLLSKSDSIGLFKVSFNGIHFSFPGQLPRCGLPHKIERWAAFNCFEKFRRN